MLRKLFGKKEDPSESKDLTIEDLIVLERWDEAIGMLQARIDLNPNDLHAHLKVAEVCVAAKRIGKALDEFFFVSDSYCDDGFYDKAIALLSKISRLAPGDSSIEGRLRRAQQLKDLEHRRELALEGLLEAEKARDESCRVSLLEAQSLWQRIQSTDFVLRLSGDQLKRLFSNGQLVDLDKGAVLGERGSPKEELFIVLSGEGEVLFDRGDGRPVLIRSFEVGDIVGDRSLLEHKPWPATYRMTTPGRLLQLDPVGLQKALQGNPDPRGLLEALRARRIDHDVAAATRKLLSSSA